MATAKPTKTTPAADTGKSDYKALTVNGENADDYVTRLDKRIKESEGYWNNSYKLASKTKENEKLYLGEQVSANDDDSDPDLALDNRIFSSIRTIIPYALTRITEPEVYPSSRSEAAERFAEDFEKALYVKADMERVKAKSKFSLEDAFIRRRGYLKPRYDPATKNFCYIEYVPPESIIIDHKAKPYEEPRYFRHLLDKTPEDLITMFPDMKARILDLFKIPEAKSPLMQESVVINEDWSFILTGDGLDLVCCWNYKQTALGCIQDPNWRYGKPNFLPHHMMPLIFFNVLSDGRSFIDRTSYVEQAKYLQHTIDARRRQIGKNAGLGNIGMPVVPAGALADDQAQYVQFEPDTVLELDLTNAGVQNIQQAFTTWKGGELSPDVYKDAQDAVTGVENTFGASSIFQGSNAESKTLGQDELLRDQSMGRQAEIVDAVDNAMNRLYLLMAQFLLIYGNEQEMFTFVGENGDFDYVIMHSADLDTEAEIRVKSGTSMPVDNPQRRATADKAAQQAMIDPLTYWEIMDKPNAQKIAKRLADYTNNPQAFMQDTQDEPFDREAYLDIELIKHNKQPPYRDDLDKSYFDYLNYYVVSGNLENPLIDQETRQAISSFIDTQLARAQKMLGMAETQLPTPQDVTQHNQQVDEANAANATAMQGMPPAAPQPTDETAASTLPVQ